MLAAPHSGNEEQAAWAASSSSSSSGISRGAIPVVLASADCATIGHFSASNLSFKCVVIRCETRRNAGRSVLKPPRCTTFHRDRIGDDNCDSLVGLRPRASWITIETICRLSQLDHPQLHAAGVWACVSPPVLRALAGRVERGALPDMHGTTDTSSTNESRGTPCFTLT